MRTYITYNGDTNLRTALVADYSILQCWVFTAHVFVYMKSKATGQKWEHSTRHEVIKNDVREAKNTFLSLLTIYNSFIWHAAHLYLIVGVHTPLKCLVHLTTIFLNQGLKESVAQKTTAKLQILTMHHNSWPACRKEAYICIKGHLTFQLSATGFHLCKRNTTCLQFT